MLPGHRHRRLGGLLHWTSSLWVTLCLCDSQPWNCTHSPGPLIISGHHCPRPVSTVNKLHGVSMVPCFSPYTLTWEISSNSHSCNVHFSTANSQQSILSLTCLQVPAWLPDNSPKLKLMIATQVCSVAVGFTSCFCMTSLKPTITFIGIQNDFHFPPSFHLDSRRGGPILFLVTFDFIPFLAQSPPLSYGNFCTNYLLSPLGLRSHRFSRVSFLQPTSVFTTPTSPFQKWPPFQPWLPNKRPHLSALAFCTSLPPILSSLRSGSHTYSTTDALLLRILELQCGACKCEFALLKFNSTS